MEPYKHVVQYYETDKMGIVHHSNYIRWMEEARVDFLRKIGWGYERLESEGLSSPVTAIECKYRASAIFPDEVSVKVGVCELKGAVVRFDYLMTAGEKTVFEGRSEHCFIDGNGKIVRMNRAYPEFYERLRCEMEARD